MASDYSRNLYNDYETLLLKYEKMSEENKILKKEHALLEQERQNQYGSSAKSLMLLLMNTGNVSVNKVRKMICGLSQGEMNPSEGYIVKQQKKAAHALEDFLEELKQELLRLNILYWDDTVIMVSIL